MNASCSECWLGVLETRLNSPLGYDEGMEETFSSLTSSCSVSGYSVTSPTAYALNTTAIATSATSTSTTTSTCTLCVPPQCNTYTWKGTDTCDSVVGPLGNVTILQFLAWNPNINSLCLNSDFFIGYEVCVSPPGGYLNHTSDPDSGSTSNATAADATSTAAVPTNALDGKIDANCINLELGEAYCVKPVGSLTSYAKYTVTGVLPITVTPVTFSSVNTDIPTTTSYPGFVYTEPAQLPTAPYTLLGCYEYANPSNNTVLCRDFATDYEISMDQDQLVEWNPSLSNNVSTCTLTMTYSYCVLEYSNSTGEWE
ncbi:hypothetical protein N7449_012139 [Penicillium cf. viridicatum]|uniref:LysM domain-containing protein n=1 Tax=Penicillium cf. viridicatum TaxID=2972119 RepID=A0A9W9IQC6_9EURO|nr:hypothetical protein N7449_012139 [Penicillium cf. viridicatum]